jgi:hypothetical protein
MFSMPPISYICRAEPREIEKRLVVNVRESRLDFGDTASADVEACDLQLCGEIRLRPAERVAPTANLRADVILETHTVFVPVTRSLSQRSRS